MIFSESIISDLIELVSTEAPFVLFCLFVCLYVFFLNSLLIKILTFRNRYSMTPTQRQIIRVHGVLPLAMDNCLRFNRSK